MQSIQKNVIYNYTSFVYATIISLIFMPLLHQELGSEAFGLIGIYVLFINLSALLDVGLVTAVSRECALHQNNTKKTNNLIHTIRFTSIILHVLGILILAVFINLPNRMYSQWINFDLISLSVASKCLMLIILTTILRWITGLYRGIINGFERQLQTSIINTLTATLRFPVSYLLISQFSDTPLIHYFQLQLLISILEYVLLLTLSLKIIEPISSIKSDFRKYKQAAKGILKIALSISILSLITTIYTQIDKLLLIKLISLREFGDLSLIQAATTGLASLGGPIAIAIIPRLTNLLNNNNNQVFLQYRDSQKILFSIMIPSGATCVMFSSQIIFSWTGNIQISNEMANIFSLYALGAVAWVLSTFPCHLKYALGQIRYLIIFNVILILIYTPMLFIMAKHYGALGASFSWLSINLIALFASYAFIVPKFFKLNEQILIIKDLLITIILSIILVIIVYYFSIPTSSRFMAALQFLTSLSISIIFSYGILHKSKKIYLK